jgi:hypothetical protein
VRNYLDVSYRRTLENRPQEADIRPAVRRMVVLRSDRGKKAPFSPDGPLLWSEIDVVRTDLFAPALVPALFSPEPVQVGSSWLAAPRAVQELTDFDPVESGEIRLRYEANVTLEGRNYARLTLTGQVQGTTEDGPARQRLDGTIFFDLAAARLASLNIRGTRELLGPNGETTGRIEGQFTLTRTLAQSADRISEAALQGILLAPDAENTLLLYDDADLGARFLYPRRWRVAKVQGRQLTLEEPRGGGVLLTLEPGEKLPTVQQYLQESRDYLSRQGAKVTAISTPQRWTGWKPGLTGERFRLDAEFPAKALQLEYAVVRGASGGAVVAGRWRRDESAELTTDWERILQTLELIAAK